MTIVQKAILKHPSHSKSKLAVGTRLSLSLFRVEPQVHRWILDGPGRPFDGVDYLSAHDAVKGLRVLVEGDPAYVGCDLTITPVAPPPEERAAKRIWTEIGDWCGGRAVRPESETEAMAQIIREEAGIDKLTEAINLLLAYEFPRRLQPKQPGLDMTWGGLVLSIIDALEVAQQTDLSNLKKQLADGIKDIKIYSTLPPQKKPQ